MVLRIYLLVTTFAIISSGRQDASPEKALIEHLLDGYSPLARPVRNPSEPVNVMVGFAFIQVDGLDENAQTMSCKGITKLTWTDPFLSWDPGNFTGIRSLYLPPDLVWRPDIVVLNGAESMRHPIQTEEALIKILYNGAMEWMPSGAFKVTCEFNINYFPFDDQFCDVILSTNAYDARAVNLSLSHEPRSEFRDAMPVVFGSSQWEVLNTSAGFILTATKKFLLPKFTAYVRRKAEYFIVNIIFPSFLLAVLNIFVLVIPHELSDKVGVGTTLVLAYVVFLQQVTSHTPTNSTSIPFITVFLIIIMSLSAFDVIISVVLLRVTQRRGHTATPRWLLRMTCQNGTKLEPVNHVNTDMNLCEHPINPDKQQAAKDGDKSGMRLQIYQTQWKNIVWWIERCAIIFQSVCVLIVFGCLPIAQHKIQG